jgi:hypothetical protein
MPASSTGYRMFSMVVNGQTMRGGGSASIVRDLPAACAIAAAGHTLPAQHAVHTVPTT